MSMGKFLIVTTIVLLLFGCAATPKNTNQNKDGVYGVQYPLNYNLKLCHEHTGLTVFSNFRKQYDLSDGYLNRVVQGYKKGIQSTGNSFVVLQHPIILDEHIEVSFWNATPSLTSEGKDILKNTAIEYGIDFLLHPSIFTSKIDDNNEQCLGVTLKTGGNNAVPFYPLYVVWIFDARNGSYVGRTFIRNDHFKVSLPANLEEITLSEIQYYEEMVGKYAEEGIRQLINGK